MRHVHATVRHGNGKEGLTEAVCGFAIRMLHASQALQSGLGRLTELDLQCACALTLGCATPRRERLWHEF